MPLEEKLETEKEKQQATKTSEQRSSRLVNMTRPENVKRKQLPLEERLATKREKQQATENSEYCPTQLKNIRRPENVTRKH